MHLYFVDIETDGLDPDRNAILEIGVIQVLASPGHGLIQWDPDRLLTPPQDLDRSIQNADTAVRKMHKASGLWDDLQSAKHLSKSYIRDWVRACIPPGAVLAGYSVHFDKQFLERKYDLEGYFSHRVLDVSTLRAMRKSFSRVDGPAGSHRSAHRVIPDCQAAIAEFQLIRGTFFHG